jgi:hypothetical protein
MSELGHPFGDEAERRPHLSTSFRNSATTFAKAGSFHVAGRCLLVLIHPVDELAFESLVENVLEVLQRVEPWPIAGCDQDGF